MSEPFIAEIRIFAGNFAIRNWAFCDGQLLPIAQNTALFSLVGTTYGGDGRVSFGLPDLRDRVPMHPGRGPGLTNRRLGQRGGTNQVTLTEAQMPSHTHTLRANTGIATVFAPDTTRTLARSVGGNAYRQNINQNLVDMNHDSILPAGNGQPHENRQPYLALTFLIALVGIYPSRG